MNQSDDASGKAKPTYTRGIVTGILLAVVCVLVYVVVVRVSAPHHTDDDAGWLLKNTSRPVAVKLVSGETVVKAGEYRSWTFTVDPQSMQNIHVAGTFHALGGSGNDIQVVLAEESEFENWKNGHQARVFYSTAKTTNGKFDVVLTQGGTYVLAFSNAFSALTDKEVSAEVTMRYLVPPGK